MEELKVEYIPINEITAYKDNCKKHPQKQIEQIKESIKKFGMNDPIAIDENNIIIEGHGRIIALEQLINEGKYDDLVPVIYLRHLSEQQKKAYIIAHNQLTMNTGFDFEILSDELERITDFDMEEFDVVVSDFSYIDELMENGLKGNNGTQVKDTFDMTFVIPNEYKEEVDEYLKKPNAKQNISDKITELAISEV